MVFWVTFYCMTSTQRMLPVDLIVSFWQPPEHLMLGSYSSHNPAVWTQNTHVHPVPSSNRLTSLIFFVNKKKPCTFCIACKRHPSSLLLTLPWYLPVPLREGCALWSIHREKLLLKRGGEGDRAEGSVAAGVLFLEMWLIFDSYCTLSLSVIVALFPAQNQ